MSEHFSGRVYLGFWNIAQTPSGLNVNVRASDYSALVIVLKEVIESIERDVPQSKPDSDKGYQNEE